MAQRSVELNNEGEAEVNPFIFNKSACPNELRVKEFKTPNWEWAEFVMKNRDRSAEMPYAHGYDIVIGPVADSSVDPVIKDYREEFGDDYLLKENLQILASRLKYPGDRYTVLLLYFQRNRPINQRLGAVDKQYLKTR